MFENSLRLVEDCGLTWLHVFPYSAAQGHARRADAAGRRAPSSRDRAARLRAAGRGRRSPPTWTR